ncbi:hypothetical protein J1614_005451 [Plenodomus biglobosus]|nr:hypothetical protein J1614_005451 [Plenodomus biglobosus]
MHFIQIFVDHGWRPRMTRPSGSLQRPERSQKSSVLGYRQQTLTLTVSLEQSTAIPRLVTALHFAVLTNGHTAFNRARSTMLRDSPLTIPRPVPHGMGVVHQTHLNPLHRYGTIT